MQENFPFVHPPLKHQMEEWLDSRDKKIRAYLWEAGTGKSKTTIDTMAWLWLKGEIDIAIIFAKKGEYSNWKYVELPEHMPKEVPYVCEIYRSAMRKAEKDAIKELAKPASHLRILCVNVESMPFEGGVVARVFAKTRRKGLMAIVDEATCVKNHKAARSKEVYKVMDAAQYKRIMTGTSVTKGPLDLWGQGRALGKYTLGHTSFFSFKGEYAIEEPQFFGNRVFKTVVGYQKLDKLNAQLRTFASIKERSECFDLPPKIFKKIAVQLTDRQETLYQQMRDEAIAELGDGEIVSAVNALGIISRLDQIACGQLKRADGTFEIIESGRPTVVLEQLEITDKKGIIWCNYRGLLQHYYELIAKEFGPDKVGRYYGGVDDLEREETVKNFQNPEHKLQWIVANQQSLGFGRTLTTGKENIFVSNGYNLEYRLQSEERTMRLGQTDSVLYTDLFTPGTVNDRIFQSLRSKKNLAHQVLGTRITDWI